MSISSTTRVWLGSAAVVSLLLASSLPVVATTTTPTSIAFATATNISLQSMSPSASQISTGTYTSAVRKQMPWTLPAIAVQTTTATPNQAVSPQSDPVVVAVQPPKNTESAKIIVQSVKTPKPVQVAATPQQQLSRSDDSSTLVKNALSLVGAPYVFGGTSRSGFDCSGFTQYVFKASGISLPRTAAEQFNVGSSVSRDQLQEGDLVIFQTYSSGPSHVGIYIGGGNFVHASNTGVRTTSLGDSYYAGRYLGARRVH